MVLHARAMFLTWVGRHDEAIAVAQQALVVEHGLSREEACILASLAADLRISGVVDLPHVLVSMHVTKRIFRAS